jgi:hypothetical protein
METFVIQIPTPPEATGPTNPDELRGLVEHVGSRRRQAFADARELLELLRANHWDEPKEVDR